MIERVVLRIIFFMASSLDSIFLNLIQITPQIGYAFKIYISLHIRTVKRSREIDIKTVELC